MTDITTQTIQLETAVRGNYCATSWHTEDDMAAKYAAVSIQAGSGCCAAVRTVSGSLFLIGEVPRLPLKDCLAPDQCRCRYGKHNDRRSNEDDRRQFETAQRSLMYGGPEKRLKRRGRRDGD